MLTLIGFQKSGKSTIGKRLSILLNRPWFDTDSLLENRFQMPIKVIYQTFGEKTFRHFEQEVIQSINDARAIVSTGGGAVLIEDNMLHLKKFGKIVYLQISYETYFERMQSVPEFLGASSLSEIFEKRQTLYEHYADYILENNKNIDEIFQKIK